MTQVRKLLKSGGKLILVETTNDALDIQLIFGTLPGWWMSVFSNITLLVPLTSFRRREGAQKQSFANSQDVG